jgi:hypothetical protein
VPLLLDRERRLWTECRFVAEAASSSALLLQPVAGPEQKLERRPDLTMTRLVIRENEK